MARPAPASVRGQELSNIQLASWARSAGFPEEQIPMAVAIALAESRGRLDAISPTRDYGPWQINEFWNPALFQKYPEWWSVTNAKMAYEVWQEGGWNRWTTYKTGEYQFFLADGRLGAASVGSNAIPADTPESKTNTVLNTPDALVQVGNAIKGVAAAFSKAGQWLGREENIVRVAQVAIGIGLLVSAIVVVVKPAVEQVAGPAADLLLKGKK